MSSQCKSPALPFYTGRSFLKLARPQICGGRPALAGRGPAATAAPREDRCECTSPQPDSVVPVLMTSLTVSPAHPFVYEDGTAPDPSLKPQIVVPSGLCFLSILLTYMIAKWRNVSLLILRRSCVRMCPRPLDMACRPTAAGQKTRAIDDKIGSFSFPSGNFCRSRFWQWRWSRQYNVSLPFSERNLRDVLAHLTV